MRNRTRTTLGFAVALALSAAAFAPAARAQGAVSATATARVSVVVDTLEVTAVLSSALGTIRDEFMGGRAVVDRVVIDTTRRMAPPLLTGREHPYPERWARANRAEAVTSNVTRPCSAGRSDCMLDDDVAVAVAFSDPVINGDTARVIARYSTHVAMGSSRVSTVVEVITLRKTGREWRVVTRAIKAAG